MAPAEPLPLLSDGDVRLRAPSESDAVHVARWGADPEFARYQWASEPWADPPALAARFLTRFLGTDASHAALFMIDAESQGGTIGYINYRDVRPRVRSCELGVGIGERGLWGQGYGTRAIRLLLEYLFSTMDMHKVMVRVVAFNTAAIRTYETCGFRREGLLQHSFWLNNRWWDSLLMALFEDEWAARKTGS